MPFIPFEDSIQQTRSEGLCPDRCKLPLVPHFGCNNNESNGDCIICQRKSNGNHYHCVTCDEKFHKECIESPLEIKHPSYPFLSLKLHYPPLYLDTFRCSCCQESVNPFEPVYICPTYKLVMLTNCAMKPIPIVIDHVKRHLHTLTFFPKQNSLVCNVCGVINEHFPTYVCARCVYVVHQDCIYSPNVIRISRHQHRISFNSSLPSGEWSCGVCRRKVDNGFGAYSCNKCDGYFVHTRCALRKDLWDGEELEGVPEEPEIVVEPFETIAYGIILHISHGHRLTLEMSKVYDEDKYCQACILPIYEGSYYSCTDRCDFVLHETCARAPVKKQPPLHAHSLALTHVKYNFCKGYFKCDACKRVSCGFVYVDAPRLALDIRCASVSEPFEYEGHEHPLFLALTPEEERAAICKICQEEGDKYNGRRKLNCIECGFIICFACATLPYKARYKHDKHFLTFREKEEANGSDHRGWCDVCESEIVYSRKGGFYSCDDYCSTTVHVDCLLGQDLYMMKAGHTFKNRDYDDCDILRNKTMSRPLCHGKEHRCREKVVFEEYKMTFCSRSCIKELYREHEL